MVDRGLRQDERIVVIAMNATVERIGPAPIGTVAITLSTKSPPSSARG